jgi:alanine--tRNA ligase
MEFTNASIAAFQPYVVSGEAQPPANPLVIPQFCFRTTDIDNVGITGAHHTVFNMIGQHQFVPAKQWDQNKVFRDLLQWFQKGHGLPTQEITIIEDSWAGGGNLGPCIEFFSRGCEIGNQVYMMYEQTPSDVRPLDLKVLDMGMGMERNAWFSQGTNTIYDATFPEVMQKLMKATGLKVNKELIRRYAPHAGLLNIDEVDDIQKAWKEVAHRVGTDVQTLREQVLPLAGLYSVAEHARALLILFSDGGLPSNMGDGYNLRVILRRALSFIDQYAWKVDMKDVMKWHAQSLKSVFPEFMENFEDAERILDHEVQRYQSTKQKSHQVVSRLLQESKKIDEKTLVTLYDSQGISPELVREEAGKFNKTVVIPDNFYSQVAQLHAQQGDKFTTHRQEKIEFGDVPGTQALYYQDYQKTHFTAQVVKQKGKHVLLDKTYFYPTSGGQLHDVGTLNNAKIIEVFKQGPHIVHVLEHEKAFNTGEQVHGEIDKERRIQLAQHHTTAHILNAAARRVLGNHINQASAHKDIDKGRLDITHYQSLTPEEIVKIEKEANAIVKKSIPMRKSFVERGQAEKEFGVGIYQGGVVPGKELRIVEIPGVDVEACGGTHLDNTKEAGDIKIIKTSKISDSIVRIEYVSGKAAQQADKGEREEITKIAQLLEVQKEMIPGRAQEVFEMWKNIVKKKKDMPVKFTSTIKEHLDDEMLLKRTAQILKTQPDYVLKTLQRFLDEIRNNKK